MPHAGNKNLLIMSLLMILRSLPSFEPDLQVVDVVLAPGQVLHLCVPLLQLPDLGLQAVSHLLSLTHLLQVGLIQQLLHELLQALHGAL